ncbi:hypothetical protein GCM10022251_54160 [Phytohabitans flavus]|uniref:methionine adenosyltransferase n=1 Tax=Phytohabitans flavus TaxID=1076124 RepID=A0A6F8XM59_9ACTN|nr:hypothetical protein Pflav_013050 [Phytohabitans flavus]
MTRRLFTSESVTEGHPDKIADRISGGVLDALIGADPRSRVTVDTLITTGQVHVAGEVTTRAFSDIPAIVWETILRIGYDSSKKGFDGASWGVNIAIGSQSPDIAQGVDSAIELRSGESGSALDAQGAGDQGITSGFACTETPDIEGYRLLVNPTGRFELGGSMGDARLTGRKIVVDTYGGCARHGGGAFSGKDLSNVDHSAAYAMRWVAKNVVAAGLAQRFTWKRTDRVADVKSVAA